MEESPPMITIATLLWDANAASRSFSSMYSEAWAERLYRGFARNLTQPFRFVCFTDRDRTFAEPIEQVRLFDQRPSYASCIEPYRLDAPMILCGLDTVVVGPCDDLADYCFRADVLAVPRDPYKSVQVCNGVALVPGGQKARMWDRFDGRNDMEWIRANPHAVLDDLFPGRVLSFKAHVAGTRSPHAPPSSHCRPPAGASLIYFHGKHKAHDLAHRIPWIAEHWR